MSHTPGPWRIVRIDGELVGSIYRGKTRICAWILDDMKSQREAEANAHLIAAAPEMLAVLEKLSSLLVDGEEYVPLELREELTTAIRKARGEE